METFGLTVAAVALALSAAILSNRLSDRIRIPAPAFFLVFAAVASDVFPDLARLPIGVVQQSVSLALVVLLFNGGLELGWASLRPNAVAVVVIGLAGTLGTAALLAPVAHLAGFAWLPALLLATALAPTDPAVVFSVLGRREIGGRTGLLLQGEAGANDPISIALMAGLLSGTGGALSTLTSIAVQFGEQMAIGAAAGIAGGIGLRWFVRRVPLPSEGLYPLRTLAGAFALYGLTTAAHGSGFLAVFLAGILLGDTRAPYKAEIRHFHASLASLAEIVAFTLLGLTVSLHAFFTGPSWEVGLGLAAVLVVVARPVVVLLLTWPMRLTRGERGFLAFAGLKGAVPILLGSYAVSAGEPSAHRLYIVVFAAVAFSVIVQAALLPAVARRCRVPMATAELEPWALGVRLSERPEGVRRVTVQPGSAADGRAVAELDLGEDAWLSLAIRSGTLVPLSGSTRLQAGDEVLVLIDSDHPERVSEVFGEGR